MVGERFGRGQPPARLVRQQLVPVTGVVVGSRHHPEVRHVEVGHHDEAVAPVVDPVLHVRCARADQPQLARGVVGRQQPRLGAGLAVRRNRRSTARCGCCRRRGRSARRPPPARARPRREGCRGGGARSGTAASGRPAGRRRGAARRPTTPAHPTTTCRSARRRGPDRSPGRGPAACSARSRRRRWTTPAGGGRARRRRRGRRRSRVRRPRRCSPASPWPWRRRWSGRGRRPGTTGPRSCA